MEANPRFSFKPKKDGSPSYFQPFRGNENSLQSFSKHGYIIIIPTSVSSVNGKSISGTNVRDVLGGNKYSDEQKRKFFKHVFGWFDVSLYELLADKFSEGVASASSAAGPVTENVMLKLKEMIKNALYTHMEELVIPQGTDPSITAQTDVSTTQDTQQAKIDAQKEKEVANRELDVKKKELDYKKKDVEKMRKTDIPSMTKKVQDLNKSISGGGL